MAHAPNCTILLECAPKHRHLPHTPDVSECRPTCRPTWRPKRQRLQHPRCVYLGCEGSSTQGGDITICSHHEKLQVLVPLPADGTIWQIQRLLEKRDLLLGLQFTGKEQ